MFLNREEEKGLIVKDPSNKQSRNTKNATKIFD